MGTIHVLLGVSTAFEDTFKQALEKTGEYTEVIVVRRAQKASIVEYLKTHEDVNVLVLQEMLNAAYSMEEIAALRDLNESMRIMPILTDDTMADKQKLLTLYNAGVYCAIPSRSELSQVMNLVMHGRSRIDARNVYGIQTLSENVSADAPDYAALVSVIESDSELSFAEKVEDTYKKIGKQHMLVVVRKLSKRSIQRMNDENLLPEILKEAGLLRKPSGRVVERQQEEKGNVTEELIQTIEDAKVNLIDTIANITIGFAASRSHVGATYNTIAFATFLSNLGYRVAVVESSNQKQKDHAYLVGKSGWDEERNCFLYKKICFYTDFSLKNLQQILLKESFNFILIDFGVYTEEVVSEFNRCTIPIVISGAMPWESRYLTDVFEIVRDEAYLSSYFYLFSPTNPSGQKVIKKNMGSLKNVYFYESLTSPFSGESYPAMLHILKNYLPSTSTKGTRETNMEGGKSVFQRIKRLFD